MKTNIVKMSLVTAMLLSTGAYAGEIIGADISGAEPVPAWEPNTQFGFGGWDLSRSVTVNITDLDYNPIANTFDESDGTYETMDINDSFESVLYGEDNEIRGRLHGKDWPVGEPAGIKIINGDKTSKGKAENCIMTTSYLTADKNDGVDGLLNTTEDAGPAPVICSSPFQSHKRFKVNMTELTVDVQDDDRYGKPFYLAFNLEADDNSTQRYQVFSKINNYTGMRLDGYKIEVLDGEQNPISSDLNLSLGLGENIHGANNTNIWDVDEMANYSHGLWGPQTFEEPDPHFPTDGFFDVVRAGFGVSGHGTSTLVGEPSDDPKLASNYVDLFGLWLPSKWQPYGIFHDGDNDPLTDADLVAFWGKKPTDPVDTEPKWLKGQADNWAEPTIEELLTWYADPLYSVGHIEDTLNLGLNYNINIGSNSQIGTDRIILRITPRVAADQTPPNYIDEYGEYIEPPAGYTSSVGTIVISPEPTFAPGATLTIVVADTDLNEEDNVSETTVVLVAVGSDDTNVTLTETDENSSVFTGTVVTDGALANDTVVTATYIDESEDNATRTAETRADDGTETPPIIGGGGGGGGCTYNPNSKNFDMTFLMLAALGLLYPFRRRFLK